MSLLYKENEDTFQQDMQIMNPFVHKLQLENTFDKFKVSQERGQEYHEKTIQHLNAFVWLEF